MSNQPASPPPTDKGGTNINATGDVNVGGDVVGRDKVTNNVTNVSGFTPQAVQRLIIIVGVMVFVTAACFFSGGIAVGGLAFVALQKNVGSSLDAAQTMQLKIDEINRIPSGASFEIPIEEDEISSYVKFVLGPQLGFAPESGKVRYLDTPGEMVLYGELEALGNLPVVTTLKVTNDPNQPLAIQSTAIQLIKIEGSSFGWVYVPAFITEGLVGRLNGLFGGAQFTQIRVVNPDPAKLTWAFQGFKP